MFNVLVPRYYKIAAGGVRITYDVDDVCWDFVGRLCERLGIQYCNWTSFYVSENTNFSPELVQRACDLLVDESLYYDMEFYDGIEDILRPWYDLGVKVNFNSNSPTQAMIDLKREQLKAAVPGLRDEDMTFNLIIPNQPSFKTLGDHTIVFVDDTPYHMLGSTARFNIMPKCPWNTSPEGLRILSNRSVTKLDNLRQINEFVYQRIKFYLEFGC